MGHDYCHREKGLCWGGCPDCSRITEAEYQKVLADIAAPTVKKIKTAFNGTRPVTAALSLPVSNTDIDRTSEPKGHWQDGGKVWVEDHVCCLPVSNTGEWQPIETAPRDGTPILGWNSTFGARETKSITYLPGSPGHADGRTDRWWNWEEMHRVTRWHPTHWMPLPEAPNV